MKTRILLFIYLIKILFFCIIIDSSHLHLRRVKTPLFITAQEIREKATEWRIGQVYFVTVEELKGVRFDPPLKLVAKIKGTGDSIHLICALLNEYWLKTGEVQARNVPYILTLYPDEYYIYECRSGTEESPPYGEYEQDWRTGELRRRPRPPFLVKLLEVGLDWTKDIVQSDDGRVGKHWIRGANFNPQTSEDGWLIGYDSIIIIREKLLQFLKDKEDNLREILGYKFELLQIACKLACESFYLSEEEKSKLYSRLYEIFAQYQREIWQKLLEEHGITPP